MSENSVTGLVEELRALLHDPWYRANDETAPMSIWRLFFIPAGLAGTGHSYQIDIFERGVQR